MKTIKLKKGEKLKVIGQKNTFVILMNVNGDIFNLTGYNREQKRGEND